MVALYTLCTHETNNKNMLGSYLLDAFVHQCFLLFVEADVRLAAGVSV